MSTLDRMLFFAFLRSYAIVLVSLLSLYVVIDLFTNLDDFAGKGGLVGMVTHIGRYYGPQASLIFDRLCEAISLIAAMFTVAWMQRNNELLPQLSAGVSTHRAIRPVVMGACFVLTLGPLNQEFLIPRLADQLKVARDDPDMQNEIDTRGAYDGSGIHLEGVSGRRADYRVKRLSATFPESGPGGMTHVMSEEAYYIPVDKPIDVPGHGLRGGGWMLFGVAKDVFDAPPGQLLPAGPQRFFLVVKDADFDALHRHSNWHSYASAGKLRDMLNKPDPRRLANVAVLYHMRYTRPLVGILLVLFGLSIILRDHNRHVLYSTGLCLAMCALFYAAVYGCKYLGENDLLAPAFAAWLPILIFGPLTVTSYDGMQT
jgi:lipopolysaccharide export system permease protein